MNLQEITTDVLVIGGGMAGIFAAIQAKKHDVDVLVLSKGIFGRDGASTWKAGPGFQVALYPPDSLEMQAKDTLKAGCYLNDEKLVYACVSKLPEIIHQLSEWGVKYRKQDGRFIMVSRPGATYPRVPQLAQSGAYGGPQYQNVLPKQVKRLGIKAMNDLFAVDLLSQQGSIVGAIGLNIRTGIPQILRSKATVLATGGHMGCYPITLTPGATGDGCAMAYRAGAEITDMEFGNFYAYTAIWPRGGAGLEDWPALFAYDLRAKMYNRAGDEFRERYSGALRNPPLAIASELGAGRGSSRGGIYLSIKHLPVNLISNYLSSIGSPRWLRRIQKMGFNPYNEAIEIAPAAVTSFGGCKVNDRCETSLEGLYAAGELVARKEGAFTMAGNTLPLCAATGSIAGSEAGTRAARIGLHSVENNQVDAMLDYILSFMNRQKGYRPFEVSDKVQDIAHNYAGLLGRTEISLKKGLHEIEALRAEVLPNICVTPGSRRFNLDWVKAFEAINMTDIVQLILIAALQRTESRGLHFREDYPNEDLQWLKHVVFKRQSSNVTVNLEPVFST